MSEDDWITTRHYRLHVDNHSFNVHRDVHNDASGSDYIIGGPLTGKGLQCVSLTVQTDPPAFTLQQLNFRSSCSIDKMLTKRSGTIAMAKAVIKMASELDQHVAQQTSHGVAVHDASIIMADPIDMLNPNKPRLPTVPLSDYCMLLYGKTWYGRHFDAEPMEASDATRIQAWNSRLDSVISAKQFEYEWDHGLFRRCKLMPELAAKKATVERLFAKAKTWRDVFVSARNTPGLEQGFVRCCVESARMRFELETFDHTYWVIPFSTLHATNVTYEAVDQVGGSKSQQRTWNDMVLFMSQLRDRERFKRIHMLVGV